MQTTPHFLASQQTSYEVLLINVIVKKKIQPIFGQLAPTLCARCPLS